MDFKQILSDSYDKYNRIGFEEGEIPETIDVGGSIGKIPTTPVTPKELIEGGYASTRGFVDSELGAIGELEGFKNAVINMVQNPENKKIFDAFIDGLSKETTFPRIDEVTSMINKYLPEVPMSAKSAETVGQLVAPGAAIGIAAKALSKMKKGKEVLIAPAVVNNENNKGSK
jgi:hypothetical protein